MHISNTMLSESMCISTWALSLLGLGVTAKAAKDTQKTPELKMFTSVTALVFALQMLNFNILTGVSGHVTGALLALYFLGVPFAILSMSTVLVTQTIFFADGSLSTLGANILNMSLIGTGLIGIFYRKFSDSKLAIPLFSLVSVLAASFFCALELGLSQKAMLGSIIPSMFSLHTLIGIGEALITTAIVISIKKHSSKNVYKSLAGLSIAAAFLSPFASSLPDALEHVAAKMSLNSFTPAIKMSAAFPDYTIPFIQNSMLSSAAAATVGLILCTCLCAPLYKTIKK